MAVRYYDEAVYNLIHSWIKDPNMRILKVDETNRLFSQLSDMNNDKPLKLPLIALSRASDIELDYNLKRSLTFDGKTVALTKENKAIQLNAIPMTITYQLDIYTKKYVEADEYIRNFVFQFINNPKLYINIPYNGTNLKHVFYLQLEPTISDNSDIEEKLFSDQFTRWTLQLTTKDAYMFSVPINNTYRICSDFGAELEIVNEKNAVINRETDILKRN